MATTQEESFLNHIEVISVACCNKCGSEEQNWDEMSLVHNLIDKGWVVHDGFLLCNKCRINTYHGSNGK